MFGSTTVFATDGYFSHGFGIKSEGIGGVGIALPQDGLAAATNPAGTAFVQDRADLGLTWFSPKRSAEIVGNGAGANGTYDGNGQSNFFILNSDISRKSTRLLRQGWPFMETVA
ncbi:MAG: hypothetical protein WDM70_02470 [Nitrosomonadales bacterium]